MRRVILALLCTLPIASDRPGAAPAPPRPNVDIGVDAIPTAEEFVSLAKTNPIECLKASLRRSQTDFHGFTSVMQKQERLGNKVNPPESIDVWFRVKPHSVLLAWRGKPAGLAEKVLYVEGANDSQLLIRPYGELTRRIAGNIVTRDPDGKDAKSGGRVSLRDFGLHKATERQLTAWEAVRKEGRLHVEYLGVQELPELDRKCHIFRRSCDPPEGAEKVGRVEIGLDVEHWLQVFTRLYDHEGKLIAVYSFKEVKINPELVPEQFDREQLGR